MSSVAINGKNYLPDDFKKIDTKGKDPETFLKDNETSIKNNFKDEIFVVSKGDLYSAEFKSMPKADIKTENVSFVDLPDSEVKLVDDEQEKHPISKINVSGTNKEENEKFIKDTLGIKSGDKVSYDEIVSKFNKLKEKGSSKFINTEIYTSPIKGSKTGETELNIKVLEIPKNVNFNGLNEDESKKLKENFKGDLTKENISKGLNKISEQYRNHPEKMMVSDPTYNVDDKGNLNIELNTIPLPSKVNFSLSEYDQTGKEKSSTKEEQEAISNSFKKPLNPENIQKGLKSLEEFYNKTGHTILNPDLTLNGEEIDINVVKIKMPKKVSVESPEIFKEKEIANKFKTPLNMENIKQGIDDVKKMYKDAGYVLVNEDDGVQADINKNELSIKVNLAKYDSVGVYGNEKTKDRTISREFSNLQKGKPVNLKELEKGVQRVKDTGNFKSANYKLTPDNNGNTNVSVKVEEQKSNEFSLLGGYGNNEGLFAGGSVTFKNIAGEGKDLALKAELGTKKLGGSVVYTDPWFMDQTFDRKVGLTSRLYAEKFNGPETVETRIGNTTSLDIPLSKNPFDSKWTLSPSIRTEAIRIDKEFSASGNDFDVLVMPKIKVGYTDLDSLTDPREGHKFGTSIGIGTGSATFGQLDAGYMYFKPLREDKKLVLNMGINAGIQTNNSPYYEKYTALNTVPAYGVAQDAKNKANYYAVGSANLEYHLWGPVSLVAGTTVGGVGERMDSVGVGAGVKINMMGVPLTVTAGTNYDISSKERSNSINVNILKLNF